MSELPKFIVDGMLGKLASRLRMLGLDTEFYADAEDSFLLRKAREEGRVLLTRDLQLTKVKDSRPYFVRSLKLEEQVRDVLRDFNIKTKDLKTMTRCSLCNGALEKIPKAKAKTKAPKMVFKTLDEFMKCAGCGKLYWKGSHFDKIVSELEVYLKG